MQASTPASARKPLLTLGRKRSLIGWAFLSIASILIIWMSFYPMVRGFMVSMQAGSGAMMKYADPWYLNYQRMIEDPQFRAVLTNTFMYLIIQVPIMLVLALILASILNNSDLKGRGFFRTAIFLPSAVGLVAYSLIFRQMFSHDGLFNSILVSLGILDTGYNWLGNVWSAQMVIILGLLWRWTGYNMIFYLAGMQNIDRSIYEAAKIDGASVMQQFTKITVPLLRPIILLTVIMSTNGTLQLFDESVNITNGGPGVTGTRTISHHVFETAFAGVPQLGYASAISFVILILVGVLAFIQIKVGDRRDDS